MVAPVPTTPDPIGRDERSAKLLRASTWVAIGALIVAALVGVVSVLLGGDDGIVAKAFFTVLLLAAFAGVALLEARLAVGRPAWFVLTSMVTWVVALLIGALLIWLPESDRLSFIEPLRFARYLLVALIFGLGLLHVRLYVRAYRQYVTTFTTSLVFTTLGLVGLLVVLLVLPLVIGEYVDFAALYWRIVVAVAILAAVGTALLPLVRALFGPRRIRPAPRPAWPTYVDGRTPLPVLPDGSPDWTAYYTGRPTPANPVEPVAWGTPPAGPWGGNPAGAIPIAPSWAPQRLATAPPAAAPVAGSYAPADAASPSHPDVDPTPAAMGATPPAQIEATASALVTPTRGGETESEPAAEPHADAEDPAEPEADAGPAADADVEPAVEPKQHAEPAAEPGQHVEPAAEPAPEADAAAEPEQHAEPVAEDESVLEGERETPAAAADASTPLTDPTPPLEAPSSADASTPDAPPAGESPSQQAAATEIDPVTAALAAVNDRSAARASAAVQGDVAADGTPHDAPRSVDGASAPVVPPRPPLPPSLPPAPPQHATLPQHATPPQPAAPPAAESAPYPAVPARPPLPVGGFPAVAPVTPPGGWVSESTGAVPVLPYARATSPLPPPPSTPFPASGAPRSESDAAAGEVVAPVSARAHGWWGDPGSDPEPAMRWAEDGDDWPTEPARRQSARRTGL